MEQARLENVGSIDVVLTAACNLRCSYCYQNTKNGARMEWETLRKSIDLLRRSEREEVLLTFYGGEPLLQYDLIRKGVEYCESLSDSGPRVRYAMITNGLMMTPEVADFIATHRFKTRLSFDGIPAAQDHRGKGTFDKLDALLDRLRDEHPAFFGECLDVNMTVMSTTIPTLAESFAYMLGKGLRDIGMGIVDTHDAGWRHDTFERLDEQFARIHELSLAHLERTGEVPLRRFRHSGAPLRKPIRRSMCGVGRGETLTVDTDGEVSGCLVFARSYQSYPSDFLNERVEPLRMGEVGEAGFSERLALFPEAAGRAKIFDDKQEKYSSYGKCGDCRYLDDCAVCPISIGYIPGNDDVNRVPDHLCAFNMILLKWRERFPPMPGPLDALLGRAPVPEALQRLREQTAAR